MPASPTVVSCVTGGTGAGAAATTVTWTLPTVQAGDYGLLISAQSGGQAVSSVADGAATWAVPTVGTWPLVNGNGINGTLYTAPLTSADSGATLTLTFGAAQRASGLLLIVRGSAQRIDVVAVTQRTVTTTNTAVAGPTYTPLGHNSLAVAIVQAASFANGVAVSVTPDGAYTEPTGGDVSTSPAAAICAGCELATKALAGQGGVSQTAFSASTDVATARYNAIVLVIPPQDSPLPVGRRRSSVQRGQIQRSRTPPVAVPQVAPIAAKSRPRRPLVVAERRAGGFFVPPVAVAVVAPLPPQPTTRRAWAARFVRRPRAGSQPPIGVAPLQLPAQPPRARRSITSTRRRFFGQPPITVAALPAQPLRVRRSSTRIRRRVVGQPPIQIAPLQLPPEPPRRLGRWPWRRTRPVPQVPVVASVAAAAPLLPQPARVRRLPWIPRRRTISLLVPAVAPLPLPPQPPARIRRLTWPRRRTISPPAPATPVAILPAQRRLRVAPVIPRRRLVTQVVVTAPAAPVVLPPQPTRRPTRLWVWRRPGAAPLVPTVAKVAPLPPQPARRLFRWWPWRRRVLQPYIPPPNPDAGETTFRPFDGITARPDDGTTTTAHTMTTRPAGGTTTRPDDGITPNP